MTVDLNNSLFIYRYAVILQDPGHIPEQQPRFELKALDSQGQLVDPNCGYNTYEFVWDNETPEGTDDDITLQEGNSPIYVEPCLNRKRILIKMYDPMGCWASTEITLEQRFALVATATVKEELCVQDDNGIITLIISCGTPPYTTSPNTNIGSEFEQGKLVYVRDANDCSLALPVSLASAVGLTATLSIDYFCETANPKTKNSVEIHIDPTLLDDVIFTLDGDSETSTLEPLFTNLTQGNHSLTIAYKNGCTNDALRLVLIILTPCNCNCLLRE